MIIVFKVPLDKFAFQLLNGVGDYPTLRDALNPQGRPDWSKMTKNEILARVGVTIFLDQWLIYKVIANKLGFIVLIVSWSYIIVGFFYS